MRKKICVKMTKHAVRGFLCHNLNMICQVLQQQSVSGFSLRFSSLEKPFLRRCFVTLVALSKSRKKQLHKFCQIARNRNCCWPKPTNILLPLQLGQLSYEVFTKNLFLNFQKCRAAFDESHLGHRIPNPCFSTSHSAVTNY